MTNAKPKRLQTAPPPVPEIDQHVSSPGRASVRVELRRRQRIKLGDQVPSNVFAIEQGCVSIDAVLPGNRRQVMLILYPGDIFARDAAPPVPEVGMTALLPSVLLRRRATGTEIDSAGTSFADDAMRQTRLMARSGLHAFAIGRLTADERLSTLLIEMALFLGRHVIGGYVLELPMSREDMADYLVLNPDTLSRLLTRLKARNIIFMSSRRQLIIKDFQSLAAMSPLSDALMKLRAAVPSSEPGDR